MSKQRNSNAFLIGNVMLLLLACAASANLYAAATDLANGPLASGVSAATTIKPNILFILDDSGSMDDENMPGDNDTNRSLKCWGWKNYNTLAYNPATTYKPPYLIGGTVYSDGVTRFPDADFAAAKFDGYFPASGYTYGGSSSSNTSANLGTTSNLRTTAATKYYYTYPTSSSDNAATTCLAESKYTAIISSANIVAPGTTAGSAAAKTNYANWYSYYRKRAYLMKAATSEAFMDLNDNYRLGLLYIGSVESGSSAGTKPNNDLKVDDFTGAHRTSFFTKIQNMRSASSTPLRGALARAGRIYAGQVAGWDPVQYSCQQNFTILSTDGYWNTGNETASYTSLQINGTSAVGNVDGAAAAAVAATATITINGGSSSGCYTATSISVNTGAAVVELLASTPVPATCTTSRTTLGSNIATSINNATGTTGFTANYGSSVVTITAPASLGAFTATPSATFVKSSGANRTFTIAPFSGGAAATTATPRPYLDSSNVADTLADIAYYYYNTDLRTSALGNCSNTIGATTYNNICDNNVTGAGDDINQQQHMTTFTIGLGASGSVLYESNYKTAPKDADNATTQYYDIKNNTANWPNPSTNTTTARIDDLWHAAVNGRGTYYSASNADTLSNGIRDALAGVSARTGSSSAAATSNLEPVAGDNFVYVALYRTEFWDGDVKSYTIDPDTGALTTTSAWSAQTQLDMQVTAAGAAADGRTIKYFNSSASNKLKDFTYTNLTADSKNVYFDSFCSKVPAPDQCGSDSGDLTAGQKTLANSGDNLVRYLRGQGTYEDENSNANPLYRGREHVFGDVINAIPVYVKKPQFTYDEYDGTYATYKTDNENRAGTVYVAANDGMLHAIDSTTGNERWSFVPSFVMPEMWRLADRAYNTNHRYLVDGSPTAADVCSSSTTAGCAAAADWKTIVVGGLNKGGCGYYALDVTDPASPKGLWEFSHEQLGYSYGNPVVTRRKDGKWVVIFSSGYNNVPGSGCASSTAASDGNGHVFVVDALTGALLENIPTYTSGSTPAGTTGTPSGLSKLNAWLDNGDINIASKLYGGDLLGNVWRIDFDDNYGPSGKESFLLAQLKTSANVPQPVTTKPELNVVKSSGVNYNVVFVSTGKYLGLSDPSDTSQNTIYALKDELTTTGISDVRDSTMQARTMTQSISASTGETIRTVTGGATLDWATGNGWYIDLNPGNVSPGERVNIDMQLYFTSLIVAANVPDTNVCNIGGYGYLYFIYTPSGMAIPGATESRLAVRLGANAQVAGIKTVKLVNGKTVTLVTDTAGGITSVANEGSGGTFKLWRSIWREIQD